MKWIKFLLAIGSVLLTFWNLYVAFLKEGAINLLPLANIIPMLCVFYFESELIYRWINKACAWLKAPTVGFMTSSKFECELESETTLLDAYKKALNELDFTLLEKDIVNMNNAFDLKFTDKSGLIILLHSGTSWNSRNENHLVNSQFTFQNSYRDVPKSWIIFKNIQNRVDEIIHTTNKRYSFELKSMTGKKFNPFYRLVVKDLKTTDVKEFTLKYQEDGVELTTTKQKIYATSSDFDKLTNVMSSYIPTTRLF